MAVLQVVADAQEDVCRQITSRIEIGGEDLIHRNAARWEKLCEETGSAPFHRPEWIATYLRAFQPKGEVVLLTANAGDRLVAVLPLVRTRCWYAGVPLVKLAGPANAHSVRFDILHTSGAEGEAAISALWSLLKRTPGWHMLQLPVFPQNGGCEKLMACAAGEGHCTLTFLFQDSPILRMQTDKDGRLTWLGGTSRHFRHELRRYARLLEAESGDKPKLVRATEPDPRILQQFYELEASGWKGQEGSAINCGAETRAFYDQIAREAAARGYFCLHSLEVNGTMVAGAFSMTSEGCFYPMKIAHNEALRRGGPGQLLFNGILEECAGKRTPELFFGGGKDRYKTSWTPDTLPHFNGFIFSPHLRARLAYELRTRVLSRLGRLRRTIRRRSGQEGVTGAGAGRG